MWITETVIIINKNFKLFDIYLILWIKETVIIINKNFKLSDIYLILWIKETTILINKNFKLCDIYLILQKTLVSIFGPVKFTCSNSTTQTLEIGVRFVQS